MTVPDGTPLSVEEGLSELRRSMAGSVLGPTDAGYDAARICFNAMVDRRPAVIARCAGPWDVATAAECARVHDLQVAVRGGGHNPAGHCVLDGGLVIDLSLLRGVEVDGDARIARAQGGSTWVDFDQATQAHGLLPRAWRSAYTHSIPSSAERWCSAGRVSATRLAASATSSRVLPETSAARRPSPWTTRSRRRSSSRPATRAQLPIPVSCGRSAPDQASATTAWARAPSSSSSACSTRRTGGTGTTGRDTSRASYQTSWSTSWSSGSSRWAGRPVKS